VQHELRFCQADETELLHRFIGESWKPGHILATHTELLRWQYFNAKEDRYNFVVAFNSQTKEFDALLGYIPVSHFDESLAVDRHTWLAIWKNDLEKSGNRSLGLQLIKFLEREIDPVSIGGLGATEHVAKIYELLGFETGVIPHFAMFHPSLESFHIAAQVPTREGAPETTCDLVEIDDPLSLDELPTDFLPRKSMRYLHGRYINHPSYTYCFYVIKEAGEAIGLMVLRKVKVGAHCCLRIVDLHGRLPQQSLQGPMENLLVEYGAEYIDWVSLGVPSETMRRIGFIEKQGDLVLPEYFDPFEQKNIPLIYMVRKPAAGDGPYHLFKGDSDQDRPNRPPA